MPRDSRISSPSLEASPIPSLHGLSPRPRPSLLWDSSSTSLGWARFISSPWERPGGDRSLQMILRERVRLRNLSRPNSDDLLLPLDGYIRVDNRVFSACSLYVFLLPAADATRICYYRVLRSESSCTITRTTSRRLYSREHECCRPWPRVKQGTKPVFIYEPARRLLCPLLDI